MNINSEKKDYFISFSDVFSRKKKIFTREQKNIFFDKRSAFNPKMFSSTIFLVALLGALPFGFTMLFIAIIFSSFFNIDQQASGVFYFNIFWAMSALFFIIISYLATISDKYFGLYANGTHIFEFSQDDYLLVRKYAPQQLKLWEEAVIDYGLSEGTNKNAQKVAISILESTYPLKRKEEQEFLQSLEDKWVEKIKDSE